MPGDLSRPLGMRVFKLLDDMNNWGQAKYTHGEVDFFCDGHPVSPPGERMDSTHEVYGHMNINYLAVPHRAIVQYGWTSVVNALKTGNYFTSTGEILIHSWSVTGSTLTGDIEWTFPLARRRDRDEQWRPWPRGRPSASRARENSGVRHSAGRFRRHQLGPARSVGRGPERRVYPTQADPVARAN